jgi:hypothetical protein
MSEGHNTCSAFVLLISLRVKELHKYQLIYMEFIEYKKKFITVRIGKNLLKKNIR